MMPSKGEDSLDSLKASIVSTTTLVSSFQLALQSPTPQHPDIEHPPQPLALLSDSCRILKAQTTKLSLLILNKPFTPSAITYILHACSGGCLPAMMSTLELCPAQNYTHLLHKHIKTSLSRIMTELLNLLGCIPQDERGIEPQNRDTLASTGVLWAECDAMVKLTQDGIVYLATQKVEQYHGLLKDAIAELEDWDPEDDDDSESDTDSFSSSKQVVARITVSDSSSLTRPLQNLSISPILGLRKRSLATLRTVRLLYPALKKRRISTFPNITSATPSKTLPSPTNVNDLDAMVSHVQRFTEEADELAGALYENDEIQVNRLLQELRNRAYQCSLQFRKDWKGVEDEFSEWVIRWSTRIREVGNE